MSLWNSLNKMRNEKIEEVEAQQSANIQDFLAYYETRYYKINKKRLEVALSKLNSQPITEPQTLILIQGQRNALQGELDHLNKMENRVRESRAVTLS